MHCEATQGQNEKKLKIINNESTLSKIIGGEIKVNENVGLNLPQFKKLDEKMSNDMKKKASLIDKIKNWAYSKWDSFNGSKFIKSLKSFWKMLTKCPGEPYDNSFKFDSSNPCIPTIKDMMTNIMNKIFSKLPMKKFFNAINKITGKIKKAIAFFGALNALRGFSFKNFVGSFLDASGLKGIAGKLGISSMLNKAFNSHKGLNYSGFHDFFGINSEVKKIKDSWNNYKDEFKNPFKGVSNGIKDLGKKDKWSELWEGTKDTIGLKGGKTKEEELVSKYDDVKKLDDGTIIAKSGNEVHIELPDGTIVDVSGNEINTKFNDGSTNIVNKLTGESKTLLNDGTSIDNKDGISTILLPDGTKIVGNVITKPNGEIEIVPNNGEIKLDDGTIVKGDGSVIKSDGTIIKSNGDIVKPDGTIIKADGTKILSDGTKILSDGTILKSNGTIIDSNGNVITNQNITDLKTNEIKTSDSIIKSDGTEIKTDSIIGSYNIKNEYFNEDGKIKKVTEIKSDNFVLKNSDDGSSIVLSDGTISEVKKGKVSTILPDGYKIENENGKVKLVTPDGVEITDKSIIKDIDGLKLTPSGDIILSNGSMLDKNGNLILPDGSIIKSNGNKLLSNGDIILSSGIVIGKDGKILDKDGNEISNEITLLEDGTKVLPDGTKIFTDGSILLTDGTKILPDGTKIISTEDGNIKILPDGTKILPDGVKILPDGTQVLLNGTKIYPNGIVKDSNGNILKIPDGAKILADGSIVDSDGNKVLVDGTKIKPDGTIIYPSGISINKKDNLIILPDGTKISLVNVTEIDGMKLLPNGGVILENGNYISPDKIEKQDDDSILLPNGILIKEDGKVIKPIKNKLDLNKINELKGEITLTNGTKILSDGSKILPNGTKILSDGTKILSDGTKILSDGSIITNNGIKINPDGVVVNEKNNVTENSISINADSLDIKANNGVVIKNDGTKIFSDGSKILNNGNKILSNGLNISSDGKIKNVSILKPIKLPNGYELVDGTKVLNDGSKILNNGIKILSDNKILPNGITITNNGEKILKNGIIISGEYIITNNGEKIKISDYNDDGIEKIKDGIKLNDGTIIKNNGEIVYNNIVVDSTGKIKTNDKIIDKNGNIILNNGIKVENDGYVYNSVKLLFNGDKLLPDGTKIKNDGVIELSNGTIIKNGVADGELPNNVKINDDGSVSIGNYIVKNNGDVIDNDGNIYSKNVIKKSNGSLLSVDGSSINKSMIESYNGNKIFNDGTMIKNDGTIIFPIGIAYVNQSYIIGNIKVDYLNNKIYIGDGVYDVNENKFYIDEEVIDLDNDKVTKYGYFKDNCYYINEKIKICDKNVYYADIFVIKQDGIVFNNGLQFDINGNKIINDIIFSYSNKGLVKKIGKISCIDNYILIDEYNYKVYLDKNYYIDLDNNKYYSNFEDEKIIINLKDGYVYDKNEQVKIDKNCNFYFDDGSIVDNKGNWFKSNGDIIKNDGSIELPNDIKIITPNVLIKNGNIINNNSIVEKTKVDIDIDKNKIEEKIYSTDSYVIYGNFMYDKTKKLVIDKSNKIIYDVLNKVYYFDSYYIKDGVVRDKYTDKIIKLEGYEVLKNNFVNKIADNYIFTNAILLDNGEFYDLFYDYKIDTNSGDVYLHDIVKGNYKKETIKIGDKFIIVDGIVFTDRYIIDLNQKNEIFYNYKSFEIIAEGLKVDLDSVYFNDEYIGSLYLNNFLKIGNGLLYRNTYFISENEILYYNGKQVDSFADKFIIKRGKDKIYKNFLLNTENSIQYKDKIYTKFVSFVCEDKNIPIKKKLNEIIIDDNVRYKISDEKLIINNGVITINNDGSVYSDVIKYKNGRLVIFDKINIYNFGIFEVDGVYIDKNLNTSYSDAENILEKNDLKYDMDNKILYISDFWFDFKYGKLYYNYFDLMVLKYTMIDSMYIKDIFIDKIDNKPLNDVLIEYDNYGSYLNLYGTLIDITDYEVYYYINNSNEKIIILKNDEDEKDYLINKTDDVYSIKLVDEKYYDEMIESKYYFKLINGVFVDNFGYGFYNNIVFDNQYLYFNEFEYKGIGENEIDRNLFKYLANDLLKDLVYHSDGANDYFILKLNEQYKVKFDNNLLKTYILKDDNIITEISSKEKNKKIDDGLILINGYLVYKKYVIGNFKIISDGKIYFLSNNNFSNNVDADILTKLILESSN
jgi:RNase P/RNase MRP subunit p29